SYSLNLDHNLKLKGDNHSLISSLIFNSTNDDSYYFLSQGFDSDDESFNFQKHNELTVQMDYSRTLSKKIKLELGAKYIGRFFKSSSQMAIFMPDDGGFVLPEDLRNKMIYDQQIIALYNSYNFSLG